MDLPKPPRSAPSHVPSYVPTLTEVVTGQDEVDSLAMAAPEALVPPEPQPGLVGSVPQFEAQAQEQLVQRLLQRTGLILEQRLQATIAQIVQQQTQLIAQRLHNELESVVRQTLYEAIVDELAPQAPRSARKR